MFCFCFAFFFHRELPSHIKSSRNEDGTELIVALTNWERRCRWRWQNRYCEFDHVFLVWQISYYYYFYFYFFFYHNSFIMNHGNVSVNVYHTTYHITS